MISYRHADLVQNVIKNRVYDVFFYVWFATDSSAPGAAGNLVKDHNGCYSAYLEVFFPYDRFSRWENEDTIKKSITKKIETAIGQPIKQRIVSRRDEDISQFYQELREKFEPKLKQISDDFEFDSLVSHGMAFRLKMKAA